MFFRLVYDEKLAQAAYLIGCQRTGEAIVIDPERDIDRYQKIAKANGLRISAAAETHIHADFLSGARECAEVFGATLYLSDCGTADWKYQWIDKKKGGGTYAHKLLHDGDIFSVGNIEFKVVHTPGHTPEHICFLVTDRGSGAKDPMGVVTGDFLFVGDLGRPDLLETAAGQVGAKEPAARELLNSVTRLKTFAEYLQVWPAHGAGSACGKALGAVPQSTIGYELRYNPAIAAAASEKQFLAAMLEGQPDPPVYFARMKRDNKIGPAVLGALPEPLALTAAELVKLDAFKVTLIDTRAWRDFSAAHLSGALNIPFDGAFPTVAGSFISEDAQIYLIAEQSQVGEIVRNLVRIGLDQVKGWTSPDIAQQALKQRGDGANTPEINVNEAKKLLSTAHNFTLDVRNPSEFSAGALPGALNIPYTRLAARMQELPRDREILVNCQGGTRSSKACAYLQRAGFRVTNLAGGYMAWASSNAS